MNYYCLPLKILNKWLSLLICNLLVNDLILKSFGYLYNLFWSLIMNKLSNDGFNSMRGSTSELYFFNTSICSGSNWIFDSY